MRTSLYALIVALSIVGGTAAISTTPACAKIHTGVSPVADVANAGGKIEDTAHSIFTTAVSLADNKIIPRKAADDVAIAVNKLGHAGIDLNAALLAYNAAKAAGKDTTAQAAAVQQALAVVQQFLTDVGKAIPNGTIQAIDALATTIINTVAQIKLGVGL